MERRRLLEGFLCASAIGGLLFFGGCGKTDKPVRFGNEEKLWQLVVEQKQEEVPVKVDYWENTPVLYRDASMAKADSSFVPRVTGG